MENSQPLVSIVTPVFNGEKFLEQNILSVKNQDYPNIEHVIVDGLSRDNTLGVIKKYEGAYRMRWISEKDKGIADAMNKGFKMATGDIVAWLDADNYYEPGIISEVVRIMTETNSEIVHGNVKAITEAGDYVKMYTAPLDMSFENALLKNTGGIPLQPGTFFKKELYAKTGGFDLSYRVAGDFDFWLKILKDKPRIYRLDKTFSAYRRAEGASQTLKGMRIGLGEMLKIGRKYGQPFRGRLVMIIKYCLAFLLSLKNKAFKAS